jgi:protease-4
VSGLEQGRVFSGREALTYKLVDQIGGEAEAVRWLESTRNVPKGLKIIDWKPARESSWGIASLASKVLTYLIGAGASAEITRLFTDDIVLGRLRLDGLVSVWQGAER